MMMVRVGRRGGGKGDAGAGGRMAALMETRGALFAFVVVSTVQ